MLPIMIPEREFFDERTGEFITIKQQELQLEHSLISLSRWESKWKKPFLVQSGKDGSHSLQEIQDYIRCMSLNQNVDPVVFQTLGPDVIKQVEAYIGDPHTATTIVDRRPNRSAGRGETITSELIYYWMVAHDIPFECQKWHLNRLLTLIKICNIKNIPAEKMSKQSIFAQNRSLNAQRRAALHSKG